MEEGVVDTGGGVEVAIEMRGAMGGGGTGTRTGGRIGMEEGIGMVATGEIGMEGIGMAVGSGEVIGMVVGETGMGRRDMEGVDQEDRGPPARTTGSKDQGGIIDQGAGAMRGQDTKNNELELGDISSPSKLIL